MITFLSLEIMISNVVCPVKRHKNVFFLSLSSVDAQAMPMFVRPSRSFSDRKDDNGALRCRGFVFKLTSHTWSRYVIAFVVPKLFSGLRSGVAVCTDYCICVTTRFPFFDYFFHILESFVESGGINFDEPLSAHDIGSPVPPNLRQFNDFARTLALTFAPLYARLSVYPNLSKQRARPIVPVTEEGPQMLNSSSVTDRSDAATDAEFDVFGNLPHIHVQTPGRLLAASTSLLSTRGANGSSSSDGTAIATGATTSIVANAGGIASRSSIGLTAAAPRLQLTLRRDLQQQYFSSGYQFICTRGKLASSQLSAKPTEGLGEGTVSQYSAEPVVSKCCGVDTYLSEVAIKNVRKMLPDDEKDREMEREESFFILAWSLPLLLRNVPMDQMFLAIGCALTELKIIIVSCDLSVVSGCIMALMQLLRPLKWAGPIIVTLPEDLHPCLGEFNVLSE